MENTVIHRLDLLDYTEGNPEQKKNFSDAIGRAFNETGFVTIRNHGLNNALIQELYQEVKALFDLPEATKKNYEIEGDIILIFEVGSFESFLNIIKTYTDK